MNRNWDIMRNSANGADPYGTTRRMDQNRMRDRERWTSRDREEGFGGAHWFDGMPDYEQSAYGPYRHERGPYGQEPRYQQSRYQEPRYGGRYGGYGYEHGESEALGDGGGYGFDQRYEGSYGRDRYRDQGMLGRIEQGIDRAFGRDWEHHDRPSSEPSIWERVKGAFTGKGPKNWARSDERIREDVCECLTYHPHIDASEIDVVVKDGEVTLTGIVVDRRTKRLAEDIVEDVRGVRDVHNQIRVSRQMTSPGIGGQATTTQAGTTPATTTNQAWNQARR